VADAFVSGEVDEVELIYTEFISMGTQKVSVRRFLPLEDAETVATKGGGDAVAAAAFEFEPSPEAVLAALLPRYVEARLFGALLDSAASEHANRQRAMKSATDNAEELITKLSREMNTARQAAITTEIMEIVGGAEALGDDKESNGELILHHLDTGHIASDHIGGDHGRHEHSPAPAIADAGSTTAVIEAGPYGVGSAAALPDNSAPAGFTIKGNADSMLYHRPDSRSYSVTRAEVWFDSAERAEAAGFTLANTHPSPES
jgi:F-type H+-transporting ATPase subunit gamma